MHALMSLKSVLVSSLVAVLLAGCGGDSSPVPSTSYATNEIYAFMRAVQDESGSIATTVQLREGVLSSSRYIYLANGESIYTSLDVPPLHYINFSGNLFGNSQELSQHLKVATARDLYIDNILFSDIVVGKPEYVAVDTPGGSSAPVSVYVDLERSGGVMTGDSSIELPPAFQITAPVAAASVSRTSPPVLTWTPTDATSNMQLDVAYICADGSRDALSFDLGPDTGSAVLGAAHFPSPAENASSTCQAAFKLQRVRTGAVSSMFAFGDFTGIQQRVVKFTTIP